MSKYSIDNQSTASKQANLIPSDGKPTPHPFGKVGANLFGFAKTA
jgi:hypothetical protein